MARADTTETRTAASPTRRWWAVIAIIAVMTVMRLIYASVLDLRTDEAYYWTWSKENVLSFLDHPPGIAWSIRFGTAIFGDTNLGVRFGGIVAMLVTQLLLADLVRRVTRGNVLAVMLTLLLPEAALYYGLLMAKVAPDTAMIPFATAMLWSLVRLAESDDGRWWLATGLFAGLALLSKFTVIMLVPAVLAIAVFSPVLIWNAQHDWATFRFQSVRATTDGTLSLRTLGEFIGIQVFLVGAVLLAVTLFATALTAWRGYRRREPVAILLSTAVIVPFGYFLLKSLTLRVGDTWPMFLWPAGFAAVAINITRMPFEGWSARLVRSSAFWIRLGIGLGIAFVVGVFLYSTVMPWNLLGRNDPIGSEAGYGTLAARVEAELQATGATWVATTDYRTYSMLRWFLRGRVPVVEINERGRFQGFADPGMSLIRDHAGIYVSREDDSALWSQTTAVRQPLEQVVRSWRGTVMGTYSLEKITGWTPDLSPPPNSTFFRWRVLASLPSPLVGEGGSRRLPDEGYVSASTVLVERNPSPKRVRG